MSSAPVGVKVDEALDIAAVERVRMALSSAMAHAADGSGGEVVLDLSGCDFVDAVGYRMLGDVERTAERCGLRLQIVGAQPRVIRVIRMLDAVLLGDVQAQVVTASSHRHPGARL